MSQQCRRTHPADDALDLHEGGGTSSPHGEFRPTIVVGGRYVVGENPAWNDKLEGAKTTAEFLTAGSYVVVEEFRRDDNVWVKVEGRKQWCLVDPRHLTPAPEPAAAPTVDDNLLYAVWGAVRSAEDASSITLSRSQRLLASEPMRRVRAAWTAEAEAENVQQAFELVKLRAENASLREQVDGRLRDNDVASEALQNAWRERDEARAELATTIERWNRAYTEVVKDMNEGWKADRDQLKAEVERLRVAQQLPDVGPVERDRHGLLTCGPEADWHCPTTSTGRLRMFAARYLAVAAFLEAEAADTSSDDESSWPLQRVLGKDLFDVGLTSVGPDDLDNGQLAERLVALGWTRARGGQEAGQ